MKFSKYSLALAAAVMVAASGCSTVKEQGQAPQIGEIAPMQLNAVIARGRTLGELLLKAYQTNDYRTVEKINIGDGKNKFTQARFDRLMKVFEQMGGIAEYSYMGDMNMKPVRRLFWRISFKGADKSDRDMLFEVRIAMLDGECRIVGFGPLPI